jgi:Ca2+-binding RTX toxin-like protein
VLAGSLLIGGPGDDRLTILETLARRADGGEGDDVLLGTDGRDSLAAGRGATRRGAGDDDVLVDDEAEPVRDDFDGGSGRDHVTYAPDRRSGGAPPR